MFNGLCHFGNWGSFSNLGTWGWVAMILQTVFWVALVAGVIWLIVWAIRRNNWTTASTSGYAVSSRSSAKEILQARYARGEITREQYQQMLSDLS